MSKFLRLEKSRYTEWKPTAHIFSRGVRLGGNYKGGKYAYPFCLPQDCGNENLAREIRERALAYFDSHAIKWHDGHNQTPSNHLCDSQVCCVNFLFPFANQPDALKDLLQPVYRDIAQMLPFSDEDNQFVAFEWIGKDNYLSEVKREGQRRTRGANFTSTDAMVMFERKNGSKQIVLIEWKYTESYSPVPLHKARSGRDRREIYRHLYERDDCPLDKKVLKNYDALFYEPFYQLMRQQFLAHEMECAHEFGAKVASLLHISPAHNGELERVTSIGLLDLNIGTTVTDIWKKLVKPANRFASVHTEELFGKFPVDNHPEMNQVWSYLLERYPWFQEAMPG